MVRKKVSLKDLAGYLNLKCKKHAQKILDFLSVYMEVDINDLYDGSSSNTLNNISIICDDTSSIVVEITYVPNRVFPEEPDSDYSRDYKACCRRVIFESAGGFVLESYDVDFDIYASDKIDEKTKTNQQINYGIGVNRAVYDSSGIMLSKMYGVKKRKLKKINNNSGIFNVFEFPPKGEESDVDKEKSDEEFISNETIHYLPRETAEEKSDEGEKKKTPILRVQEYRVPGNEIIEKLQEDYFIDLDYFELFKEGFEVLQQGINDFLDPTVILFVRCDRTSHDVASIEILKGIYTVPTRFFAYFNLSGEYAIDLPDITFPLHVDHSAYDRQFVVYPKPIEVCKQEIDMLVARKIVDANQGNVLVNLCNKNCRDLLMSYGFSYGTIKRFSKNDGIKK